MSNIKPTGEMCSVWHRYIPKVTATVFGVCVNNEVNLYSTFLAFYLLKYAELYRN